jgi:SAM-dependent methyltransferase
VSQTVRSIERAFAPAYAAQYDLLYADKDYAAECDLLEQAWAPYADGPVRSILDVGCGTGGHALPFARRGYRVAGADLSSGMIGVAREKAAREALDVSFHVTAMQELAVDGRFDVVTCLFQAINYVLGEHDLAQTLRRVLSHLRPGGLFLFDFRNGVAALRGSDRTRVKWVDRADGQRLLRISDSQIDPLEQLFHTTYTTLRFEGDRVVEQVEDRHVIRFFYPREVRYQLELAGFELVRMTPFPDIQRAVTPDDFDVLVVARAPA